MIVRPKKGNLKVMKKVTISNIYKGKTVLITGHTGFKGSWFTLWLKQLGAKVSGISIDIPSNPSHFVAANLSDHIGDHRIDLRDSEAVIQNIREIQPDFVFHLAPLCQDSCPVS